MQQGRVHATGASACNRGQCRHVILTFQRPVHNYSRKERVMSFMHSSPAQLKPHARTCFLWLKWWRPSADLGGSLSAALNLRYSYTVSVPGKMSSCVRRMYIHTQIYTHM